MTESKPCKYRKDISNLSASLPLFSRNHFIAQQAGKAELNRIESITTC